MNRFAAILAITLLAIAAKAQLIIQDSFNYPNGPVITAAGSPWKNNYPPTNEVDVINGELFLDQSEQESVRYPFPKGYQFTNLYASFKVRFSALPTGAGNYFAFFRASNGDALFCRSVAATNGAAPGKFRLGVAMFSQTEVMIPVNLSVGSSRVDLQACKLEYSIVSPK